MQGPSLAPAPEAAPAGGWARAAAALLPCLLAACASAPTTQAEVDARRRADFDRSLQQWHGAEVRELTAKLGPPTARSRPSAGTVIYEYVRSAQVRGPVGTVPFKCVVRYSVDERSGRVVGHRIEGC